jgi:hypothetical protein
MKKLIVLFLCLLFIPLTVKEGKVAIVALISNETVRDGFQYLNDIMAVYPDGHQFSPTVLEKFNFLTIGGTKEDVEARLQQLTPRVEFAYLWASDNKYHWTEDGDENPLKVIEVYQVEGDNKWYKLENDFRFPVNVGELTAAEKQVLETVDINHPSVDSFIRKLVKDVTILSGNDVEIKELRNTTP